MSLNRPYLIVASLILLGFCVEKARYTEVMAQERSAGLAPQQAQPAFCTPQLAVVPLTPESDKDDPSVIYFPDCTRIKQCGGCCTHKLTKCQPIEIENKTVVVNKSKYFEGKETYRVKVPVKLEEHTKCDCVCVIKESNCTRNQIYKEKECICQCPNVDDKTKCLKENSKIWDSDHCTCRCRDTDVCTTGTYYDANSCECVETNGPKNSSVHKRQTIR